MTDPFFFHPELRGLIEAPETSTMRTIDPEAIRSMLAENGLPSEMIFTRDVREASRRREMEAHAGGDLWVFAYGSLMWNPGFIFDQVRHCYAPGYSREFILKDDGGPRGRPEQPGIVAALDRGKGCDGLAFRIPAALVERETEILWRRERIAPAYRSEFITLQSAAGDITALAFTADHDAEPIEADLSWDDKVRFCATGSGFLGSSLEYAETLVRQFAALNVEDPELSALLRAAKAYQSD